MGLQDVIDKKLRPLHDELYACVLQMIACKALARDVVVKMDYNVKHTCVHAVESQYAFYAQSRADVAPLDMIDLSRERLEEVVFQTLMTSMGSGGSGLSLLSRWTKACHKIAEIYQFGIPPMEGSEDREDPNGRHVHRSWRGIPVCVCLGKGGNMWAPVELAAVLVAIHNKTVK